MNCSDTETEFDGTTVTEFSNAEENVPPLPSIVPIAAQTANNTRLRFRDGNNTRAESCAEKRRKIEIGEVRVHPICNVVYTKMLAKKKRVIEAEVDGLKAALVTYFTATKDDPCFDRRSNNTLKCNCGITNLNEDGIIEKMAQVVSNFYNLTTETRNNVLKTKVHSLIDNQKLRARKWNEKRNKTANISIKGKVFSVSGIFHCTSHKPILFCRHTFQKLYAVGHYQMNSLRDSWRRPESMNKHGLCGNTNSQNKEATESVNQFFKDIEEECEDYASIIERTRLGQEYLRDDEIDAFRLPTNYTK